jgi:hypothetical protein
MEHRMIKLKLTIVAILVIGLSFPSEQLLADYPLESDVSSIDAIIDAYYEVISGPAGHDYDAARDRSLHAPQAIITRVTPDGTLQRHDLSTEQIPYKEPYQVGIFEYEMGRIVEDFGDLAHVWSTFEIRNTPDGETVSRGVNSISLYYHENRWWIASWSTQAEGEVPLPEKYLKK